MRVNEIFYSLQGEGFYSGTPAVFIRFSGCNLKCSFCDTQHDDYADMTEDEIMYEVSKYPACHIVITGGEPALQITASLVGRLHAAGKYVQMETNGTSRLPADCGVDWITCSPKYRPVRLEHIDELKVISSRQSRICPCMTAIRLPCTAFSHAMWAMQRLTQGY